MIDVKTAKNIHNILIDKFGGSKGVRDLSGLEAALARPYATFDESDLYTSAESKAAAIFESIIINHPFIDGNKRTAYVLMSLILMDAGLSVVASQDEKYAMVISASKGEIRFDEIQTWINVRLKQKGTQ